MRITFRLGNGSAPITEHLEPGEPVFDPDLNRFGIGYGSIEPLWYPAIDANKDLALNTNQGISHLDNTSRLALLSTGVVMYSLGAVNFKTVGVATAVNAVSVTNAVTGAGPIVGVTGSDTNISLSITTQGSGDILLKPGGITQASVSYVADAVNHVNLAGGAAGDEVTITPLGTDTSIDIAMRPKGAGSVVLGTSFTPSGDVAIIGYMSIKDGDGTYRKVAIIA